MNKLFTILFLFLTSLLFAQPANDECETLIDLGVLPFCAVDTFFSNVGATQSSIGNDNFPMDCNPGGDWLFTGRDVWFSFVASDTIEDYSVTITGIMDSLGGSPLINPQVAIYRGECGFDELALLSCARVEDDGTNELNFELLGLDFGTTYFMRINDWSATATPNSGSFLLCLKERDPISTIDQGGSTACTGMLFDDGGPNGDYSANGSNLFTICPNAPFNSCITFNLEYYNLEGNTDNLIFYDGDENGNSQVIGQVSNGNFPENPTDNQGGVCYTVQASSGCLTVELTSDDLTQFEGFAGSWECSAVACETLNPISINDEISNNTIIDALTTSQTVVSISSIDCAEGALGTFVAGDNSDLGLEKGIILSTGNVDDAIGPATVAASANLGTPGDADLDYFSALNNGEISNDACVVTLDVFAATNELKFEYIFGSEEYPRYVYDTGGFNDIFALLVKGPGITGDPNIDNQQNVAVVPGTNTFVEINTINPSLNWEFYRENQDGIAVSYNGLTSDFLGVKKSITASIPVIPCNNYQLKFAIADRGDRTLDSGVFIGELRGGVPSLSYDSNFGTDDLIEDCSGTEDLIVIQLNNPLEDPQSYTVNISGTATRDIDYILDMPDQVVIPAGDTELSFSIIPITDLITEGEETIIISLSNDFGCGAVDLENIVIKILDKPLITVNLGADTALVCLADSSNSITLSVTGATEYTWTPSNIFDDNNGAAVVATPLEDGFVFVTGQLGPISSCIAEDSIYLSRIFPELEIEVDGPTGICRGDTIQLSAINNVGDLNLAWTPNSNLSNPNESVTNAFPNFNQTYVASIGVTGCVVTDTVLIEVDAFDFPALIPDTTICQGTPIEMANQISFTSTEYSWTPAETIEDPTISNALAIPQETTTYILTATSQDDFCTRMDSVEVTVIAAAIDISNDTTFVCQGDSVQLLTSIIPLNNPIIWSPDDGNISDINSPNPFVYPTTSTIYFATLQTDACFIVDSVFIQVDSLPVIDTILLDPFKDIYCPDEFVTLTSPLFDPMDYPDLENLWTPMAGQVTPDSLFNLVIRTTSDTIIYTRLTTNNGCRSSVSVVVPVVRPEVTITPDTTVCTGSPFQIFAETPDPDATYEWTPEAGLSCSDCPDPVVTVTSNTTYSVMTEVFGCPTSGTYNTDIIQSPVLNLIPDDAICLEASISLGSTLPQTNTSFTWISTDPNFASSAINPVVMPNQNASYTVVADNGICPSVSETVNIEVIQPVVTLTVSEDDEVCLGDEFTLTASTTPSSSKESFSWTLPTTEVIIDSFIAITAFDPGEEFYDVDFDNGCEQFSEMIRILVHDVIEVDSFTFDPFQATLENCYDEGQLITVTAAVDSIQSGTNYQWAQNEQSVGTNSRVLETQLLNNDDVSFSIQVTTNKGCVTNADIGPFCVNPAEAGMPNAFTPGSDLNNFFNIQTVGLYEEVESFRIWNRFGDLVYNNNNPAMGWDGIFDGKLAPSDVYLYHIVIRKFTGEVDEIKGDVTLIR